MLRLIRSFRETVKNIYDAFKLDVQNSIPSLGISVSQLVDAGQNNAHRSEIQRLAPVVETLEIASEIESNVLRETANYLLGVSLPSEPSL
jgi:hypothetical protein